MIPELVYDHYLKVPVCITPDFIIRFEQHLHATFAHCDVFRWNKEVRQRLKESWHSVSSNHGGPIYAMHDVGDAKHEKFLKLFGFQPLDRKADKELWIWDNYGRSF